MRIRELVEGHLILETVSDAMLGARAALQVEFKRLHRQLLGIVRDDPVCRQLMSVPGVGAIVAITFRSGVDDPTRFKRSRDVGPHFGLTPRKYQSGELDVTGRITKVGDRMVRTALYEAASVMLTRTVALLLAQGVGNGGRQAARHEEGDASHSRASSASSSTACGSMAPTSAGPTRRLQSRKKESFKTWADDRSAPPRSRRWDGEVGEAASVRSSGELHSTDYAGKMGSPLPLTL